MKHIINELWEELKPFQDARKSFYRKAYKHVEEMSDDTYRFTLYSYDTKIITMEVHNAKSKVIYVNKDILPYNISSTTLRHLKEFYFQITGIHGLTKKQLLKELQK